jgi:hypothetical protein
MHSIKRLIANQLGASIQKRNPNLHGFCLFIGYSRSGHSLVGSLLDAHQHICIAHELNTISYFSQGLKFTQLLYLICRNSRQYSRKGRMWEGYTYDIRGQFQGNTKNLQIVGDKKGGTSANLLLKYPYLLEDLKTKIPLSLKLIHITRNPFDIISTQFVKNTMRQNLNQLSQKFFKQVHLVNQLIASNKYQIITVPLENLIQNPDYELDRLLRFLEVENYPGYSNACIEKIFKTPKISRNLLKWPERLVIEIEEQCKQIEFLKNYSFSA